MTSPANTLSKFLELRSRNKDLALKFLMDNYGDSMYGVVSRIIKDTGLAEDALQEGFIKIWKNITEFNPEKASLFTWMFTIVKNTAIDLTRREANKKIQSLESGVYENMRYSEEAKVSDVGLMQKVNQMDPKYRELIDMIYLKGYTQQEVSDELNLPLGTVKTRIQAAVKMLRSTLSTFITMLIMLFK
jgi:RNA polymerase sigma factor (sigma-70 family)